MKRVGLITIHGVLNCGSILQTFATHKVINSIGYDCTVIDYKYPNEYHSEIAKKKNPYAPIDLSFIDRIRLHFYNKYKSASNITIKIKKLKDFALTNIELSKLYSTKESLMEDPPQFDIYVTGSDQVWNPRYLYEDFSFLLPFAGNKPRIAFSASFGAKNIEDEHAKLIQPLLSKYAFISTREKSGIKLVKDICGKNAICTCDPSLLLNAEEWSKLCDDKPEIKGKYILCYILTYTANPYPYVADVIKYIRRKTKMKVVCIDEGGLYWMKPGYRGIQTVGPSDFLNLFKNASFVITSSFHGTAFSLCFQKNFYSILTPNINDERQYSILKMVGAEDRFLKVGDPFPKSEQLIMGNWSVVSEKLESLRKDSYNYLRNSLNSCTNA
jgi:hypothetical protein